MGDKIFNKTVIYSCEKHYRQNQCGVQTQEHREAGHRNTRLSHLREAAMLVFSDSAYLQQRCPWMLPRVEIPQ